MRKQNIFGAVVFAAILVLSFGAVSAQEPVTIRWYVGLGAGTDAPTIAG